MKRQGIHHSSMYVIFILYTLKKNLFVSTRGRSCIIISLIQPAFAWAHQLSIYCYVAQQQCSWARCLYVRHLYRSLCMAAYDAGYIINVGCSIYLTLKPSISDHRCDDDYPILVEG